jgi:RNA polymerase sigma-70 factor (ECF subfamily)
MLWSHLLTRLCFPPPVASHKISPIKELIIKEELSQDEFVRLLAMHSSKVMSFIRILTMNRLDDAEEIFQLTCVVLWQKFSQYDPSGDFAAWACRIAHYEMLKHRESKRRIRLLSDDALELLADAAMPISAELSERRTALTDCLRKLPASGHEMIRQKYFEGLSVEEISSRAGRSTHAIYRELSKLHGLLLRCVQRSVTEVLS